jgi:hypothetical protein
VLHLQITGGPALGDGSNKGLPRAVLCKPLPWRMDLEKARHEQPYDPSTSLNLDERCDEGQITSRKTHDCKICRLCVR